MILNLDLPHLQQKEKVDKEYLLLVHQNMPLDSKNVTQQTSKNIMKVITNKIPKLEIKIIL